MYDNNGDAFGFTYNGKEYYYIKNAQNDVTAIADSSGKVVANYQYDAWGKLLEVTGTNTDIANANPIRYRSYYYDSDTELYYLNTRYYSPDMCRFINADGIIGANQDILANNLFAYCSNDPINYSDETGQGKIKDLIKNAWNNFKTSSSAKINVLLKTIKTTVSSTLKAASVVLKNTPKPSNIGAGTFSKQITKRTGTLSKINKAVSSAGVGLAIDVGSSVIGDVIDQKPAKEIANNAMVELMFGVAEIAVGMAATNIATSILLCSTLALNPFTAGALVGAVTAFAFAFVIDNVEFGGMTIKDRFKQGALGW